MVTTKPYLCSEVSPSGLLKSWLHLSNVSYLNLGHKLHLVFKNISKQDFDEEQVRVNLLSVCFTKPIHMRLQDSLNTFVLISVMGLKGVVI